MAKALTLTTAFTPATALTLATAFTLVTALNQPVNAQERVYIDSAGVGLGITIDGQPVRKLLRDVKMRTDRVSIDADSAYHYLDDAYIRAYGIRLENDNQEILYADTLIYRTDSGDSSLFGRVILRTPDYTLFSRHIEINGDSEEATFPSSVLFRDDGAALRAKSGFYNQKTDSAGFYGHVQLADSSRYIESDTLLMNRSSQIYRFLGNVYGEERDGAARFTGFSLRSDSTGFQEITGTPAWLMDISPEAKDTTHLIANRILTQETDSTSSMDAFSGVRIYSGRFSGIADTLTFRDPPEEIIFRGNPILWTGQIQLSSPEIQLQTRENELTFLLAPGNPFAAFEDSVTSRLHQMTGDTLQAWFDDGEVSRLLLFRRNELLFHQKKESGEPDGLMTLVAAERSEIQFEEGEPSDFKAVNGIDGSFVPEQEGLKDRKLPGFRWNPEMRPSEPVITRRRFRVDVLTPLFPLPERYLKDLEHEK